MSGAGRLDDVGRVVAAAACAGGYSWGRLRVDFVVSLLCELTL